MALTQPQINFFPLPHFPQAEDIESVPQINFSLVTAGIFFFEGIVFSRVCDFFFLSVTTITLERLKQSEPNFHT